jgi:arsenate reductase-like glutaredoxin family protein
LQHLGDKGVRLTVDQYLRVRPTRVQLETLLQQLKPSAVDLPHTNEDRGEELKLYCANVTEDEILEVRP